MRTFIARKELDGLVTYRSHDMLGEDGQPAIVGFVGPLHAILRVLPDYLHWMEWLQEDEYADALPDAPIALCHEGIMPEHLVGEQPGVMWVSDLEDMEDGDARLSCKARAPEPGMGAGEAPMDDRRSRDMDIAIHIGGATPEEIARGLWAAQEVFDRAGLTAEQAASARFEVEGWDIRGCVGDVSDAAFAYCHLWDEADQAAVSACCAGWPAERAPSSARLELVRKSRGFSSSLTRPNREPRPAMPPFRPQVRR